MNFKNNNFRDNNNKIINKSNSKNYKKNNNEQKLKNIKNNKKGEQKITNQNPPKRKLSIYKHPKSNLNFRNKIKNGKKVDNITSLSKNKFLNSNTKEIEIDKFKQSQKDNFDNYELNNLEYDFAKKFDKRNWFQIYWSLLKREHLVIFTFITKDDHNITLVKYSRFFFLLCSDMAMNVFFFADETMHKIFLDYGKYNFIQQIPQIIYSTIVSQIIEIFICYLSLTDKHFYEIKKDKGITKAFLIKNMACIKVKITIFFVFTLLIFVFYWYLITCFCAVYQNTQIVFIKDSISSFLLGIVIPFILYIFPSLFRIISLKSKSNIQCVYKFSNIIPFF